MVSVTAETEAPNTESTEEPQEETLTTDQRLQAIEGEMTVNVQNIWDMCRASKRDQLDASNFAVPCHKYVKLMDEQDRLMEFAEAEAVDTIVKETVAKVQPAFTAYRKTIADNLGKVCKAVRISFDDVGNMKVEAKLEDPPAPDPEPEQSDESGALASE